MQRRSFLQGLGLAFVYPSLSFRDSSDSQPKKFLYPVLQGTTDSISTQMTVLSPLGNPLEISVVDHEPSEWRVESKQQPHGHPGIIYKVFVQGLESSQEYSLKIKDGSREEIRRFHSLNEFILQPRIAYLSCLADQLHNPAMWESLKRQNPDLIVFAGDIVYADKVLKPDFKMSPLRITERYFESWSKIDFYFFENLIPSISLWDDHDTGGNNVDRSFSLLKEAQDIFSQFNPQKENRFLRKGPGGSLSFTWGGQSLILTDGRSFKDPVEDRRSNHLLEFLGKENEAWCLAEAARSPGPVVMVMGYQWYSTLKESESPLVNNQQTFARLREGLKKTGKKVYFVGGNVHFSEVSLFRDGILGRTVDITSSSMHSSTMVGWDRIEKNPFRLQSTWRHNFTVVKNDSQQIEKSLQIQCHGSQGVLYELDVSL